jgi:hypothetical protein
VSTLDNNGLRCPPLTEHSILLDALRDMGKGARIRDMGELTYHSKTTNLSGETHRTLATARTFVVEPLGRKERILVFHASRSSDASRSTGDMVALSPRAIGFEEMVDSSAARDVGEEVWLDEEGDVALRVATDECEAHHGCDPRR